MNPSDPSDFPPQPDGPAAGRGIPARRLVLSVVLGGAILLFFFMLLASIVAILREASPTHQAGLTRLLVRFFIVVRHVLAHRVFHFFRRG